MLSPALPSEVADCGPAEVLSPALPSEVADCGPVEVVWPAGFVGVSGSNPDAALLVPPGAVVVVETPVPVPDALVLWEVILVVDNVVEVCLCLPGWLPGCCVVGDVVLPLGVAVDVLLLCIPVVVLPLLFRSCFLVVVLFLSGVSEPDSAGASSDSSGGLVSSSSSSKVVLASSSKVVLASSSKVVLASSSKVVLASSSKVVLASILSSASSVSEPVVDSASAFAGSSSSASALVEMESRSSSFAGSSVVLVSSTVSSPGRLASTSLSMPVVDTPSSEFAALEGVESSTFSVG